LTASVLPNVTIILYTSALALAAEARAKSWNIKVGTPRLVESRLEAIGTGAI
jgi:hypothetical protein